MFLDISEFVENVDEVTTEEYEYNNLTIENDIASEFVSQRKRGRKQFITNRLLAALDNAKVSDGMAVHILIAAAEGLGHDVEDLAINRTTIHRLRQENRLKTSSKITASLTDNVIKLLNLFDS